MTDILHLQFSLAFVSYINIKYIIFLWFSDLFLAIEIQ